MLTAGRCRQPRGRRPRGLSTEVPPCLSTVAVGVFRRGGSPVLTPRDENATEAMVGPPTVTEQEEDSERRFPAHPDRIPQSQCQTGMPRNRLQRSNRICAARVAIGCVAIRSRRLRKNRTFECKHLDAPLDEILPEHDSPKCREKPAYETSPAPSNTTRRRRRRTPGVQRCPSRRFSKTVRSPTP